MSESPGITAEMRPPRVTLIGDDELVRAGLPALLASLDDRVSYVGHDLDGRARDEGVDIALVDPFRPEGDGLDAVRELARARPTRHVAVYTYRKEAALVDAALAAGATAYLDKAASGPDLVADLERVAAGEQVAPAAVPDDDHPPGLQQYGLTEREADVATMLARGLRNADIAGALGISLNTVKTHLRSLFKKLDVTTRAQAVIVVLGRRRLTTPIPEKSAPAASSAEASAPEAGDGQRGGGEDHRAGQGP